MLADHELYRQLCEKRGIKSPSDILEAIKDAGSSGELKLSCLSIMVPICEVIAHVLSSSSVIKSLDLSDCMLLSKGLNCILNSLCEGTNITSVNLKGNNINGPMVTQLGQVFIHNNTLKRVHLEWNSIGDNVDSFTKFCEDLIKNHTIEMLDVRYNQISPYCAEALAKLLKCNKSLKVLDLSWNTIGLHGGQLILAAIKENKIITKLNLHGNCIPNDVIHMIDKLTCNNENRQIISSTSISKGVEKAKSFLMKDQVKVVSFSDSDSSVQTRLKYRRKKKKRVRHYPKEMLADLPEQLQKTDSASNDSITRSIAVDDMAAEPCNVVEHSKFDKNCKTPEIPDKIKELNQILEDRTTAINLLTNEIAVKDAEIEAAKSLGDQLKTEISQIREEQEKFANAKTKEIMELKNDRKESEEKWQRVYRELKDTYNKTLHEKKETEMRIRRYERDIHKSCVEICSLKEKIISITKTYEDLVCADKTELHKLKRELKERETRHKNEMNMVKTTLRDTTQALEACQMQLQKSRAELRDANESLSLLKEKIHEMEHINIKYSRSEESLHKVKEEKDNLEEKLADGQRTIANLQRQVATLQSELIEPQRRYKLLNDELLLEQQKANRLKEELIEEREHLKEQNIQMQKMALQITALNTQINDIQCSHAETLRERDKERKQLKEIINLKEQDLNDLKAEEVQRAGQLYAAFSKYLGSRGPNPVL